MGDADEMVLSDAARELEISHVSAWRYVQSGRLVARKVGPIYLVKRADLEAFKATRKPAGRPKNSERKD